MDFEKKRRRHQLKVIISEAIMVLTMIITVAILALVVSGYWLSADFTVERQGMLQISSLPTGADLYIDGETAWLQRTNTSKILSSGEHTISLTKEGYDSWTKTINVSEGLLYRIHYPRLFLQDRTSEPVFDASGFTSATVSPNFKKALLFNNTTEWTLINLDADTIKPQVVNISAFFSDVSLAPSATVGLFSNEILSCHWDKNSEHILIKTRTTSGELEWVLLDVANIKDSINLTKEFGASFSTLAILDNSASSLLAISSGNLRKIDTRAKTISNNLVQNVISFDHYDNEVVFVATNDAGEYNLGLLTLNDATVTTLETVLEPAKIAILQFYDDKYIATLLGQTLVLHAKDDYEKTTTLELTFAPDNIKVGHHGEFITMTSGTTIASVDMEDKSVREWTIDSTHFGWLDDDMFYAVQDGELKVYDFDGLNPRVLARNVSNHFPVTITNNKWLYYFSDGSLIREAITK